MLNLKDEKSYIYNSGVTVLQIITGVFLVLYLALNSSFQNISIILRNLAIIFQLLVFILIGIKSIISKKNKAIAYINFLIVGIVILSIIYVNFFN